jgi:histidinol dehydrogenase
VVSRDVAVDLPAGPSELLVLADDTADPRFIALDLLSQSEHGPDTVVGVVTPSEDCARQVIEEIDALMQGVERGEIIVQALAENGFVMVCEDLAAAVDYVNAFAPEHLEIVTRNPAEVAERIVAAGLILLGPYSPVAGSDYCFGTNHVLPTGGFSRTYSGLSAMDFVKRVNVVTCTKERLKAVEPVIRALARSEGLPNHWLAVQERVTS